ncbi:MAG: hypothetical protein OEZ22_14225 [Spirochaetia bacterium]|nr:hypothetical protein [Spirochaetia bacterium]
MFTNMNLMIKINKFLIIFLFLSLIFSNCRSLPPVSPTNSESAAVMIKMRVEIPVAIFGSNAAEKIFLIEIDEKNPSYFQQALISSTYSVDDRIYYLNAKPGKYAIVGAFYSENYNVPKTTISGKSTSNSGTVEGSATVGGSVHRGYTILFSNDIIKESVFEVNSGKLNIVGDFLIKMSREFENADDSQKHYGNIIEPGLFEPKSALDALGRMFSPDWFYIGFKKIIDRSDPKIQELTNQAQIDFKDTTWEKYAKN